MKDTNQTAGPAWVKSSYSAGDGGQCVEVAWTKSSYSSGSGGDCVEVADAGAAVLIRDSKRPAEAFLSVGFDVWDAFVRMAARG
ncbi:DUF397 domain-containing protein [Streptomyces sp. ISL-12]|uniref:DUF397 domain-containing protein n=1 Tax=Streptomyces sp. ISL-12 TaxID=2819177 RepID=UPI001BE74E85|nr:DUF397 domain-containing protein [Streptomyces sp. ISL-12]MBT2411751.1 DUF397 domain-containing protein [Streptomyces sp. ISL-12]